MERLKLVKEAELTLEDGCKKYLEYCRQRNLRDGTIRHYRQVLCTCIEEIYCS